MKNNKNSLSTSETSTIIQAKIEDLSVRQLLERDRLVRDEGLSHEDATRVVRQENQNGL